MAMQNSTHTETATAPTLATLAGGCFWCLEAVYNELRGVERVISGYLPLASIGLISFCAVANFAPGLVLGLYWRRAHRLGAVAGLAGGFAVWLYALLLPTLQQSAAAR